MSSRTSAASPTAATTRASTSKSTSARDHRFRSRKCATGSSACRRQVRLMTKRLGEDRSRYRASLSRDGSPLRPLPAGRCARAAGAHGNDDRGTATARCSLGLAPDAMSGLWPAPAKLNLFLHVIGRRADGYHEIQTAYQLIDLQDELAFRAAGRRRDSPDRGTGRRRRGGGSLPARRAAPASRGRDARKGSTSGSTKRIPIQGGLGGGSSDAATTLVALNEIWGLGLGPDRLAEIGLELGADIPLFIHGHSAWGEGVGERLTPLELPPQHFAIVFPGVGIRTADVFQASELTRKTPKTTIRGFLKAGGHNDCEPVVAGRSPEVRKRTCLAIESRQGAPDRHRQLRVRGIRRSRGGRGRARGSAARLARFRGPGPRPFAPAGTPGGGAAVPRWREGLKMGCRQVVRQRVLIPSYEGSNPSTPAS